MWRYFFTYKHSIAALATYGSYHGMELFYVFNTWENATLGSGIFFKPSDDSVQVNMLSYWTNFAKTGNPNGAGLTVWPEFNPSNDTYIELKATPNGSQAGVRTEKCNFWDVVTGFTGCTGSMDVNENHYTHNFTIYPNPVNDIITITSNGEWQFSVYNSSGVLMISNTTKNVIDISSFPQGLYLLVATTTSGNDRISKTFLKF